MSFLTVGGEFRKQSRKDGLYLVGKCAVCVSGPRDITDGVQWCIDRVPATIIHDDSGLLGDQDGAEVIRTAADASAWRGVAGVTRECLQMVHEVGAQVGHEPVVSGDEFVQLTT